MDGYLPWAAIGVIGTAILALWAALMSTRRDLEEFRVKVAEDYTTTALLDKTAAVLAKSMDELKIELREFRREIHGSRFPAANRG